MEELILEDTDFDELLNKITDDNNVKYYNWFL
jgi:hypothetical protein